MMIPGDPLGLDVDNIRLNLAVVISEQSAQQRVNLTLSSAKPRTI